MPVSQNGMHQQKDAICDAYNLTYKYLSVVHSMTDIALLLGLDDSCVPAIEVEQVVREAMAWLLRELADSNTPVGGYVSVLVIAHLPVGHAEQLVNVFRRVHPVAS